MKSNKMQHSLGQYFTTNITLKAKVHEFILNNPTNILEPSVGQGDLVAYIATQCPLVTFDMYEIDTSLESVYKPQIIYGDFMVQPINKTYKTIVGNPPYVKTKKGNLYIDFTEKCFRLLDDGGELIFIVPSDFFKLTSAATLLNAMMTEGTFTHIYHPHNEKLFENASIDVLIYRYCKNKALGKVVRYNDIEMYLCNNNGLITCNSEPINNRVLFQDYFDVYVGLVSGKEEVYKNAELGNIEVLNGENKVDKYIYITEYPCSNEAINQHLLLHKPELINRGIRKFNENNWFEWGAPRNIATMNANMGKDCIYICNLTRKPNVAFVGKVGYFGGSLIMLLPKPEVALPKPEVVLPKPEVALPKPEVALPKPDVKKPDLNKVVAYLNSDEFKSNFMFSGRFKIGHRQICNSYIF